MRFDATLDPSPSAIADGAARTPENPFCSEEYARFRRATGDRIWAFVAHDETGPIASCLGFERTGRLNRSLEIASLPELPEESNSFWTGLLAVCSRRHVTQLELGSFASRAATIPALPHETERRQRTEFVIDLQPSRELPLSTNHRRSVARARAGELVLHRSTDPASAATHDGLMQASMVRRAARGEHVAISASSTTEGLLAAGAGELFQTVGPHGRVLSSVLVLRSKSGGYYQSAGTSPEGMECGASPFLIVSIANALATEGASMFNLGGAGSDNPGLQRFKAGFGTRPVALEAAGCCPSGAWRVSLAAYAKHVHTRASTFLTRSRSR